MTADKPLYLVPKLRFEEFVDEPPWEYQPLIKLAKRITQRNTHDADLPALTNSAESGVVDQREYFDKDIAINTNNYYIVKKGDYVYNPRISSTAPVGPISKNQLGTGVISPLYTVFRFQCDTNDFFAYYFKSSHWHGYLRRMSNSGARHDRMTIKNDDVMQIPIPFPSPREQRKIADCLGSLDDLVAAEGRKLDALRQHKQGLMQQLFPQPGETRPRLRFPEFENAPDWEEASLGTLLERPPDYGVNAAAVPFSESLPTYIRITDINDDGQFAPSTLVSVNINATDEQYLDVGDIVLARTGASVGKSYRYREEDGRLVYAGFLIRVRPNPKRLLSQFLAAFLSTWSYWDWVRQTSERSGQPGINSIQYASIPLPLPPDRRTLAEQQKIADCLTSIDDQLNTQARKLDALKQHKQGLLQQLFPCPEEK